MFRAPRHHHGYPVGCGDAEAAQLGERGKSPPGEFRVGDGRMARCEDCNHTGSRRGMEIHKISEA